MATQNNSKDNNWFDASENGRNISFALITFLGLLSIFLIAKTVNEVRTYPTIGESATEHNVITVSGEGSVSAVPDIGTFSFTLSETAPTIAAAQKLVADKGNAALNFLKKSGVDEKDIKTESYNTNPHYVYSTTVCTGRVCPQPNATITGYDVNQTVSVKVRKLDQAGTLIAGLGALNIGTIGDLSMTVDSLDALKYQARDIAIANARMEALRLAKSLGVSLGKVTGFSESTGGGVPVPMYKNMMAGVQDSAASGAPALPTGENKIISDVTVNYEIQ
ncbi:MAG: SIMPL domain-containing protein [Candidatus Pacebacteria bacterium]|nr:SIMPL domain-containing protein [Candidatus Paceibacterota bacterium]